MVTSRSDGGVTKAAGFALMLSLFALTGCDMGMEQSSNRYEQLNIETRKLLEVLKQVTDEAAANEHLDELNEAGDKIRDIIKRIADADAKKKDGNMGMVTNFRQSQMWITTGDSARRQIGRIREADPKAGAIVDQALEGIEFPDSMEK